MREKLPMPEISQCPECKGFSLTGISDPYHRLWRCDDCQNEFAAEAIEPTVAVHQPWTPPRIEIPENGYRRPSRR